MDHNPDRIAVWPGYFDAKVSRRSGRRVPRDSSVLKPDLEGLFIASRALGLRKVKREERVSHPNRPHAKEGRLWVSKKGAKESIGAGSKEEILQLIGGQWRQMQKDQRNDEKEAQKRGPKVGDKRARSQRKGSNKARAAQARAQRSQKQRRRR
jgi:signal recognition particle subunit SEC65